jgi:hypothetical protein
MRSERSYPWGIDEGDPRLELRRRAAEAQRDPDADELPAGDTELDDSRSTDWEDWGPPAANGRVAPAAPVLSRK